MHSLRIWQDKGTAALMLRTLLDKLVILFLCTEGSWQLWMQEWSLARCLHPKHFFFFFGLAFRTRGLTAQKKQVLQMPLHRLSNADPSPWVHDAFTPQKNPCNLCMAISLLEQRGSKANPRNIAYIQGLPLWLCVKSRKKWSWSLASNSRNTFHTCNIYPRTNKKMCT